MRIKISKEEKVSNGFSSAVTNLLRQGCAQFPREGQGEKYAECRILVALYFILLLGYQ